MIVRLAVWICLGAGPLARILPAAALLVGALPSLNRNRQFQPVTNFGRVLLIETPLKDLSVRDGRI